jgi:hypothetical protein
LDDLQKGYISRKNLIAGHGITINICHVGEGIGSIVAILYSKQNLRSSPKTRAHNTNGTFKICNLTEKELVVSFCMKEGIIYYAPIVNENVA